MLVFRRSASLSFVFAASMALAGFATAPAAQAQQVASIDNWLDFGDSNKTAYRPKPSAAPSYTVELKRGFPTISSVNIEYMRAAIKKFSAIVKAGGWKKLPIAELKPGASGKAVVALRNRLKAEGLLSDSGPSSSYYDYYLEEAVEAAQARHGLTPTGILNKRTILALNVSARERLAQLRTNLSRLKSLSAPQKGRYVMVNIPAAQIEAVENNEVVSRHVGVVGQIGRQTPILQSQIHEINFNKDWLLPPTVIKEDLLPKARVKNGYKIFERYGIDVYADYDAYRRGKPLNPKDINWSRAGLGSYFFAQKPGKDNPLGFLKINFHNAHAVYMHDTPSKTIFSRNFRAESSGCVRIQNIGALASWLLRGQGWDESRVNGIKKSGETLNVDVKDRVKLYFAYVTAWATPDGRVHFRRDLYKRDGVSATASAY
ncbi:MAG: L,D-transpeptidase family protein [Hyphomicrobiales bacterium]|nr:L,D-transpeptidase family protein [Hyphomicrobiales bacterium]